jgi:adenylosuccinate lyase
MTYLTDQRRTLKPMPRKEAHDLVAALAAEAYSKNIDFKDVLMNNRQIRERFSDEIIMKITNPEEYIGQSKEIMETVFRKYHKRRSLTS